MQTGELERWRRQVVVAERPLVYLSVVDIYPHAPKTTIVLLHALGGQAADWAQELEHLSIHNRVIAPDLRGHGRSDRQLSWVEFEPQYGDWSRAAHNRDAAGPNDGVVYHYFDVAEGIRGQPRRRRRPIRYTRTLLLADLERMLAELRVEAPFVLAGCSFGALLAAEYARAHPASVSKLVLIGLQERYELKQEYKLLLSLPDRLLQAIAITPSASLAVVKNVYVNSLRGLKVKSAIAGLRASRRIQSAAPELFFTE